MRSDDLFLLDSFFKSPLVKKSRSAMESIRFDISPKVYFFGFEQSSDAFKMLLVYDLSVGRIFQRLTAELSRDLAFRFADRNVFSFLIRVSTLFGTAGLPAVWKFPDFMCLAARARSAFSSTGLGLLTPISCIRGLSCEEACRITSLPALLIPLKEIKSKRC